MLAEQLNENIAHLEAQLAHTVKDANGTSYNRAIFVEQRRAIIQRWADYLDVIKGGMLNQTKGKNEIKA